MEIFLLCDYLFQACSGSEHAEAVLLASFPSGHVPVVAATPRLVPILLDPAAAMGRHPPWHVKLQCSDVVTAFLLVKSSMTCTRQPLPASTLARFCLPAWSSIRSWLLRLSSSSVLDPARLRAPAPVLHLSAPTHRHTYRWVRCTAFSLKVICDGGQHTDWGS